jgi:hypothetical protein
MIGNVRLLTGALALLAPLLLAVSAQAQSCPADQRDNRGGCPIPLHMEKGAYGLAVTGHLTPQHYRNVYLLQVGARQSLVIAFAGAHAMTGEISCGADGGDGPWYGGGNVFTTAHAGTCFINVGANTRADDPWSGNYTLTVVITTPQPAEDRN